MLKYSFYIMYNLKKCGGSFKGIIGECLFKLTNDKVIVTKFFNKSKYLDIFGGYFNEEQKLFLINNWYSIDAIDIFPNITLYEIKTRNRYAKPLYFKPKMTLQTHNLYNEAKRLKFNVVMITIWLNEEWDYDVEMQEFDEKNYCIDKSKRYDKKS